MRPNDLSQKPRNQPPACGSEIPLLKNSLNIQRNAQRPEKLKLYAQLDDFWKSQQVYTRGRNKSSTAVLCRKKFAHDLNEQLKEVKDS